MVIQTRINDGISTTTRTWRKIYKGAFYDKWRLGFLASAQYNKWGEMVWLKGKQRILLAKFGKVEND